MASVVALCFALPAVGATSSPLKIARSALTASTSAKKTAASAKTTAASARKTALTAKSSADAANTKAQSAVDALKKPVAMATNATSAANAVTAQSAAKATTADTATKATTSASADNVAVLPFKAVPVTGTGATQDAARAAATEVPLATHGSLSIYGKCYLVTGGNQYGEVYAKSTVDRALLYSSIDTLIGPMASEFLNAATVEDDRTIIRYGASANTVFVTDESFNAIAADGGSWMGGDLFVGVKRGALPSGNGPWPAGDGCTFNGVVHLG